MYNILDLSGLFVFLGDLISLSVPGGTEKIAELWFARDDQYPGWHYALSVSNETLWKVFQTTDHLRNPGR